MRVAEIIPIAELEASEVSGGEAYHKSYELECEHVIDEGGVVHVGPIVEVYREVGLLDIWTCHFFLYKLRW